MQSYSRPPCGHQQRAGNPVVQRSDNDEHWGTLVRRSTADAKSSERDAEPPPPRKHRTGSTAGCVYISSPNYNLTLHVGLNGTKSGLPWDTSGVGEEVGGDSAEAQVLRPVVSTRLCVTVRLRLVCPTLTVTLRTCQLQEDQILLISQSRTATLCRSTTCCSPKLTSLL